MTKMDGVHPERSLLDPLSNATLDKALANSTNQQRSRLAETPFPS